MQKSVTLAAIGSITVLSGFMILMVFQPKGADIEFSSEGIKWHSTSVGEIPEAQIRKASNLLSNGDRIDGSTIISETYKFMISAPDDTWLLDNIPSFVNPDNPSNIQGATIISRGFSAEGYYNSVSIFVDLDASLTLQELVDIDIEVSKKNNGYGLTKWINPEGDVGIITYYSNICTDGQCSPILWTILLQKNGNILYTVFGSVEELSGQKPYRINSELQSILESFTIFE